MGHRRHRTPLRAATTLCQAPSTQRRCRRTRGTRKTGRTQGVGATKPHYAGPLAGQVRPSPPARALSTLPVRFSRRPPSHADRSVPSELIETNPHVWHHSEQDRDKGRERQGRCQCPTLAAHFAVWCLKERAVHDREQIGQIEQPADYQHGDKQALSRGYRPQA